jgi:hypothetical protein
MNPRTRRARRYRRKWFRSYDNGSILIQEEWRMRWVRAWGPVEGPKLAASKGMKFYAPTNMEPR